MLFFLIIIELVSFSNQKTIGHANRDKSSCLMLFVRGVFLEILAPPGSPTTTCEQAMILVLEENHPIQFQYYKFQETWSMNPIS